MVTLDDLQEPADLIGPGLSTNALDVYRLRDPRVDEDVVAPTRPRQSKAQAFNKVDHVIERNTVGAAENAVQEPSTVHGSGSPRDHRLQRGCRAASNGSFDSGA
jgi:hypothetical protein